MTKLFMITNSFPYGRGEKSFIIPELPFLSEQFKLTIISKADENERKDCDSITKLSEDIDVICICNKIFPLRKLKFGLKTLLDSVFLREVIQILRLKKKITTRIKRAFFNFARGKEIVDVFSSYLPMVTQERFIVYCFWCTEFTVAAIRLKEKYPNMLLITRMLGYDLYNEREATGRQEYRWYLNRYIDAIFFETPDGLEYYKNNFPDNCEKNKLFVSGLGVLPQKVRNPEGSNDIFILVSCSNVIPLKRVDLIIDALVKLPLNIKIKWIHFGSGSQFLDIKAKAQLMLSEKSNISYDLKGHLNNYEIMEYYLNNHIDCFITVSSAEAGIPVSVLEALSVGIPVIATNVGGMKFGVSENGVLLPSTPTAEQICGAIIRIISGDRLKLRDKSFEIWSKNFNTNDIKRKFISLINDL